MYAFVLHFYNLSFLSAVVSQPIRIFLFTNFLNVRPAFMVSGKEEHPLTGLTTQFGLLSSLQLTVLSR